MSNQEERQLQYNIMGNNNTEEQEWIEQPGGWGKDPRDEQSGGGTNHPTNNKEEEDEEGGFFDLFADENPQSNFSYNVNGKRIQLEGFTVASDEAAQSTGVTLWEAAPRLANYIQSSMVTGKAVLELGAGLGLCGMVAHHLGAKSVDLTDADTITLQRLRHNVSKNCDSTTVRCRQLIWNNLDQMKTFGTFDILLGADVIYTIESLDPLFDTVTYFLQQTPTACFILSRFTKWGNIQDETVLDAAQSRNLVWTHPSEGIYIFQTKQT